MGISILLPLYLASGATFDKVSILGTTVKLENPTVITSFLILLFFYFILRYWQYFNEETYVQNSRSDLKRVQNRHVIKYARKIINSTFKKLDASYLKRVSFLNMDHQLTFSNSNSLFSKYIDVDISLNKEEAENPHHFLKTDKQWSIIGKEPDNIYSSSNYEEYKSEVPLNKTLIFYHKTIGFLKFIFNNSLFTDYYLPVVIWLVSFIYLISTLITKNITSCCIGKNYSLALRIFPLSKALAVCDAKTKQLKMC